MNQQTLLGIYEKIEALIARLPGPLQSHLIPIQAGLTTNNGSKEGFAFSMRAA